MVHISAELRSQGYKARDLWGRKNGRLNVQPNVVVFKEESPMVLRNFVSPSKVELLVQTLMKLLLIFAFRISKPKEERERRLVPLKWWSSFRAWKSLVETRSAKLYSNYELIRIVISFIIDSFISHSRRCVQRKMLHSRVAIQLLRNRVQLTKPTV